MSKIAPKENDQLLDSIPNQLQDISVPSPSKKRENE
jgi:hypothetical protein